MRLPFALFLPLALLTLCSTECTTPSAYIAQCNQCCFARHDDRLTREIVPLFARQCPECRLLSAAYCTDPTYINEAGFNSALIRYRLILPGGAEVEHCAHIFRTSRSDGWTSRLYPPDSLLQPRCDDL